MPSSCSASQASNASLESIRSPCPNSSSVVVSLDTFSSFSLASLSVSSAFVASLDTFSSFSLASLSVSSAFVASLDTFSSFSLASFSVWGMSANSDSLSILPDSFSMLPESLSIFSLDSFSVDSFISLSTFSSFPSFSTCRGMSSNEPVTSAPGWDQMSLEAIASSVFLLMFDRKVVDTGFYCCCEERNGCSKREAGMNQ